MSKSTNSSSTIKMIIFTLVFTLGCGSAAFGKSKKHRRGKSNGGATISKVAVSGATVGTTNMLNALQQDQVQATSANTTPAQPASQTPNLDKDGSELQAEQRAIYFIESNLKNLASDNANASWIFEYSLRSIRTIFAGESLSEDKNVIRTIKQTACIFVAETLYGNLSDRYDECDQSNIGQIRPPAYKEAYNACPNYFRTDDLAFLGSGTNCNTVHPYEMPLCCEAVRPGENPYSCQKYHNDPLLCITKEKRDYLESSDFMSGIDINSTKGEDGQIEPIKCYSTEGSAYYRIPAIPSHSVFTSIFYLKLIGFDPMSDSEFANFGAKRYNASPRPGEQRGYQLKLNTCLNILDKPDNEKIIEKAYKKALSIIQSKKH